ncbi:hypothetical protein [Culturomica massiliensis]|uniref:hypothetical protein n=1 Tax=Culturomica massiliensis TaxID=1841857 RepID=UPI003AB5EA97
MRIVCVLILSTTFFMNCTILRHSDDKKQAWNIGGDIAWTEPNETLARLFSPWEIWKYKFNMQGGDTLTYWIGDSIECKVPIRPIEQQLYRINEKIYDVDRGSIPSCCEILLEISDGSYYYSRIDDQGILNSSDHFWQKYGHSYIVIADSFGDIKKILRMGITINGITIGKTEEVFRKGEGWWEDYYVYSGEGECIIETDTGLDINFTTKLKERGRVKNNFKVGRWRYYDPHGRLVRTERFRLRDSVDIRFPYSVILKK